MSRTAFAVLAASVSLLATSLSLIPVTAIAQHGDGHHRVTSQAKGSSLTTAQSSLRGAVALFSGGGSRVRLGPRNSYGPNATILLRDVVLGLPHLDRNDRQKARSILARPTDAAADEFGNGYRVGAKVTCQTWFCVHWVNSTNDAPPLTDGDQDGVPDWVATTSSTMKLAWERIINDLGYRQPKSDRRSADPGPDGTLDVYLADLGDHGVYGYCTTDDPDAYKGHSDVSVYCVLDNDFKATQFGGAPPQESLEVTAAHEFFHAVQAAYDFFEDPWLMEGTAAWAEDQVFDDSNDHYRYLKMSPLSHPQLPMDAQPYGAWLFWQFLTEYFGDGASTDPTVIRHIWQRADASWRGTDDYSVQAIRTVARRRGTDFRKVFAAFGARNRVAKRWYSEGRAYPDPAAAAIRHRLSRNSRATGQRSRTLDHLSNQSIEFLPERSLDGRWRIRIIVDLPHRNRGSAASLAIHHRTGAIGWYSVDVNRKGVGQAVLPFGRRSATRIALTLTNSSTRYNCWSGTSLACRGNPTDDDLKFSYSATILR